MNFEEFTDYAKEHILDVLGAGYEDATVEIVPVNKENHVFHSLIVKNDNNISPCLYLEQFYEKQSSPAEIIKQMAAFYQEHIKSASILKDILCFDKVKDKIVPSLVNTKLYKEMLQSMPHYDFNDLSIIYRISVNNAGEPYFINVTNELMKQWDIPLSYLDEIASDNIDTMLRPCMFHPAELTIRHMGITKEEYCTEQNIDMDILNEIMENDPTTILTNEENYLGSAVILSPTVQKDLADKFNGNYYMLPCSVHEWMCIADDNTVTLEGMITMLEEANAIADSQDILSNSIYLYNNETQDIEIAYEGELQDIEMER